MTAKVTKTADVNVYGLYSVYNFDQISKIDETWGKEEKLIWDPPPPFISEATVLNKLSGVITDESLDWGICKEGCY